MHYPPPPVVRRRRAERLFGGSVAAVGVSAGPALRLSGALANAGVLFVVLVVGVDADATDPFPVGMVLCCFCGELCADGGAFWGELMEEDG